MKPDFIKNWTIERRGYSVVVCGNLYNDSKNRFVDGTYVRTSRVEYIDFNKGLVKTRNSIYELDMGDE